MTQSKVSVKKQVLFDNLIWLNTKEAAEYLRISENNLRAKVSRGEVPYQGRLGKNLRFRRDALDKFLEASTKEFYQ